MSTIVDNIKTKLSSATMTPVYLCIALLIGAMIFFAVMRLNNDWAEKLFQRNLDTATKAQIAEQKKTNDTLAAQVEELERDNDDLAKKLSGLEKDADGAGSAGNDAAGAKTSVKGKTKSAVATEFKKLGY